MITSHKAIFVMAEKIKKTRNVLPIKRKYNALQEILSGISKKFVTSCTPEMTASWKETHLPTILSRYELKDIFSADEFGLFYQALPSKSMHFKNERCSGGKFSKVLLTGLAAANATGEKLLMFVIEKSAKSRCFKNVKKFTMSLSFSE